MKRILSALCLFLLAGYIGIYNGKIAIWMDSSEKPTKVLPYSAELLPKADQEALKKRIPFDDVQDLTELVQDYLS